MKQNIFYKLLRPMAFTSLFAIVTLLTIDFYFRRQIERLYEFRKSALMIRIYALEVRREQDEYFLTGDTFKIEDQKKFYLMTLHELEKFVPTSKMKVLKQFLVNSEAHFLTLTQKDDPALLNKLLKEVKIIESLTNELTANQEKLVKAEQAKAHWATILSILLSLGFGYLFVVCTTRELAGQLFKFRSKVQNFKPYRDVYETSDFKLKEIRKIDEAFKVLADSLFKVREELKVEKLRVVKQNSSKLHDQYVIVIDKGPRDRNETVAILEAEGATVFSFASKEESFVFMESFSNYIHAIVCDYTTFKMNDLGFDENIPVIFTSRKRKDDLLKQLFEKLLIAA